MLIDKTNNNIVKGDVIIDLLRDGSSKLGVCTHGVIVYDRQGGEGACIKYEDGTSHQFSYCEVKNYPLIVVAHFDELENNPIRQLLNWRRRYER